MIEESTRTLDQAILSAWQAELKATRDPSLKQQLSHREGELLPQFIEHYQQLKGLRRRVRRGLQRKCKQSLAGIALLLALGQGPALAATINVNGTTCTLVNAITAANNNTATGGCTAGLGADTIVLPANSTQTLTTVNNTFAVATGLPVIRSDIIIAGNNSTITRAASAPEFRILAVGDPGNLTLRRTTITGGSVTDVVGVAFSGSGGGILHVGSNTTLTLTTSTISGNFASNSGGGIAINGDLSASKLVLTNSTVSGNSAQDGGGIDISYTNASLDNSTISGNTASSGGGGVTNYRETVILTNSTISGNEAQDGGGALNGFGKMFFVNSTISGNRANSKGGGVYSSGLLTGGLRSDSVFNRTLIAGNTATVPDGVEVYQLSGGVVTANNFNLFGDRGSTTAQALGGSGVILFGGSDITATSNGTDPTNLEDILNTTLANNGGPTLTHALPATSPAVDAVTNVNTCPPPAQDQRGITRPQDGNGDGGVACDIGSYERQ
jgi:hypothetical protein